MEICTRRMNIHWNIRITIDTSPPGHNGRHFTNNIFTRIFVNEKFSIFIQMSPKFVLKGPIDNSPALI